MAEEQLTLRFHHDVIEHLGLRLYQNKPTKVICELVSNSWDADATRVAIETAPTDADRPVQITVLDNGVGMDRAALQSSFLTIASPRRGRSNSVTTTPTGRPLMGRKGLGKLAPFGISKRVNVVTIREGKANWIELDLDAISEVTPDSSDPDMARYHPNDVLADAPLTVLANTEHEGFSGKHLLDFLEGTDSDTGTAIVLGKITDRASMSDGELQTALGRRFTVTLARPDFIVTVNDSELRAELIYPNFVFRIPESGFATDTVGENSVRYWVGFTEKPITPNSEAGVGVYAHGKLAQERPFFFFLKGNDIALPYLYGVVEADWVDEVSEDLISTDRSNLDWKHPATQFLLAWGQRRIRDWLNRYQDFRRDTEEKTARAYIMSDDVDERIKSMTDSERESLVKILSEITPVLPPAAETRANVTEALTDAWLHKPARDMINKLWEQLREATEGTENIGPIIESIREYMVPEAMSTTVTLSQRAFALTVLYNLINAGTEPDLQKLIESFPWLVGPNGEYLTANQTLKKVVSEAEKDGRLPRQSDKDSSAVKDTIKPDFVLLSNSELNDIIVVEIKSPQNDLTLENREQLHSYMTFLEQKYSGARIKGILVGNSPSGVEMKHVDMVWMSWRELFSNAKAAYAEIIASMISGYADSSRDLRVREIHSYGGDEIWNALKKLSERDSHLHQLMTEFGSKDD